MSPNQETQKRCGHFSIKRGIIVTDRMSQWFWWCE